MKTSLLTLFSALILLTACDPTNPAPPGTLEKLHGTWYGVEISNHLIAQGQWDTLHYHNTTMMTLQLDTADGTVIIDSAGITLDTAQVIVNNDSTLTFISDKSNLSWAFDASLINTFGQPILDSLKQYFNGTQTFHVLNLTETEAVFYMDTVIPIQYMGFQANMELKHTQYWQK